MIKFVKESLQNNFCNDGDRSCWFVALMAVMPPPSPMRLRCLLKILKEKSLQIPKDVAVIGFDDTPWSSLLWPPLTVISENTYKMGVEAAKILLNRIEKKERSSPQHIMLEDELIIREST